MIRSIHSFPQVDQPNNRERARRDLESEGERRLCFPRGRHLQRVDNDDGQDQDGKAAGNVESGIKGPECYLLGGQSQAWEEMRELSPPTYNVDAAPLKGVIRRWDVALEPNGQGLRYL